MPSLNEKWTCLAVSVRFCELAELKAQAKRRQMTVSSLVREALSFEPRSSNNNTMR